MRRQPRSVPVSAKGHTYEIEEGCATSGRFTAAYSAPDRSIVLTGTDLAVAHRGKLVATLRDHHAVAVAVAPK